MQLDQLFMGLVLAASLLIVKSVNADLNTTTIERYDVAVAKAVAFLQSMPQPEERETSLVAYALLKAGVELSEPRLAAGIQDALRRSTVNAYDPYRGLYLAAVDAMLLADVNAVKYAPVLQKIADRITSFQRNDGSWHDPKSKFGPAGPGDVSLTQYCVLGLWAAQRSGSKVAPRIFDRTARFLIEHSNSDGGWSYLATGPTGESTMAMTVAGIGTIGISRLLLYPQGEIDKQLKFGVLEHRSYNPEVKLSMMDASINHGLEWNHVRFAPVSRANHLLYYYYTLERAAALVGLENDWYTNYGDGLLTLQAADGHFDGHTGLDGKIPYRPALDTSFAILYYMRSTQQILDFGKGVQVGSRDLVAFLHPETSSQLPTGPLDDLLAAMEGKDFSELDVNTDEVVEKIQFSSREELIGQADKLKILLKSPDATNRQIAYWALSRTGEFDLVPLLLDGLNDPVLSVNVEALTGLRYISKQPSGFELSLKPLSHLPDDAHEEKRISAAAVWRAKASRLWRQWYSNVRPYAERDGLDEIGLPVD